MREDPREAPPGVTGAAAIEQRLIVRFVAGDREAFSEIFDRLHRDLHALVRRFFRGAFDQEEAMQEVWIKLYRMRGRFDVNRAGEFVPWIRQVARNRCLDLLKARGRSHEVPVAEMDLDASSAPRQLSELRDRQLRVAIQAIVSGLDAEQQRFFALCFVEEQSHEEIAAALGISERRSKYLKKKLLAELLRSAALREHASGSEESEA
jgi:RNA polymerase sigma-70 factor (ECF subfamily)